jgi:hypothetical protein
MATSKDWFAGLGKGASFGDRMTAVRQAHGKGASRWIAGQAGVSQRTAQRWLAGTQQPSKTTAARLGKLSKSADRRIVAARLRKIRTVTPGHVGVVSKSDGRPDGYRHLRQSLNVSPVMDAVADAWMSGDESRAQSLFDDAVMATYGGEAADYREGLAGTLGISDYRDDFQFTEDK